MIGDAIRRVVDGGDLAEGQMASAMRAILGGEASDAQIAALAVGLRMKGETIDEIAAAARVMRERCAQVDLGFDGVVLDTCGTGGDGAGTFNISTVSAIVVAGCGVSVAKHGNRAVSSKAGSADLLEALGVSLEASPEAVARSVREVHIGFLFAPAHHAALKHAAPVRRQLGLRTFFNLLGPLANPAGATHQIVGVYDPARVRQVAEVLGRLGTRGAWVVHGHGGLDEVSPCGPTRVAVLSEGEVVERTVEPADFGLDPVTPEQIGGGDAARNAAIARAVLEGERGGPRTAVVMNAAAALVVAGEAHDLREAAARAASAIDSGAARETLAKWVASSGGP
ncbi:MAG: anthranilate phosphoribosyltransferase [Myxococcota bacterium]